MQKTFLHETYSKLVLHKLMVPIVQNKYWAKTEGCGGIEFQKCAVEFPNVQRGRGNYLASHAKYNHMHFHVRARSQPRIKYLVGVIGSGSLVDL